MSPLPRKRQLHEIRGLLSHLTGALEMSSLFYPQDRGDDVAEDAGAGEQLHPLGRTHGALQRAVDGEAADINLGGHVRGVSQDQLGPRPDLPFKPSVDPERLFEGQVSPDVTAAIDESIERRTFASGFHRLLPGWLIGLRSFSFFRTACRTGR